LPPVQVVAGIIFENEDIVYLVFVPNTAGQTKQEKKEVDKEVTSVELLLLEMSDLDAGITHL
jgi:hypothetical protein